MPPCCPSDDSSQAMRFLEFSLWLPKPLNHMHTHFLALRALERETEADDHLQRAYERVMSAADKTAEPQLGNLTGEMERA